MKGFVYILINPIFRHTLLKIGKTSEFTPEERAKQISQKASTGLPTEYIVAYSCFVSDCELVEKIVHKVLDNKRSFNNREFFDLPLDEAVRVMHQVIDDLTKQHKIEFLKEENEIFSSKKWWALLSFSWKQIFRKHLEIDYKPNEIELLKAIHIVIDNSKNELLRKKITELLVDVRFANKIEKWYETMNKELKKEFNSYLPYEISEKEMQTILDLKELNCTNSLSIIDLKPVENLLKLEIINCSNTNLENFTSLAKLKKLRELNCVYTDIDDLLFLKDLENLQKITCFSTKIVEENVKQFLIHKPNCKVEFESFLKEKTVGIKK